MFQPKVLHFKQRPVSGCLHFAASDYFLKLAANHHSDQLSAAKFFGRDSRYMSPIPQHCYPVGQRKHFFYPVRNVDDCNALFSQTADDLKQPLRFVDREGRGRLVHNQNAGPCHQCFCYLNELLFANPQPGNRLIRLTSKIQRLQSLSCSRHLAPPIHKKKSVNFLLT